MSKEYKIKEIERINREWYGLGSVKDFGPILSSLYSDRTHFILELIQNAEDACERDYQNTYTHEKRYYINFELFKDRLEIENNGILFDENDVLSICRVRHSSKENDVSQIGKFGIGFKSVYAYTHTPEIYSGDWCFKIKDYVFPYPIKCEEYTKTTKFILPFNNPSVSMDKAIDEISQALNNLSLRTILFLKNIQEINWINNITGRNIKYSKKEDLLYSDESQNIDLIRITLLREEFDVENENIITYEKETWIVSRKMVSISINELEINREINIDVAFLFDDNNMKIVPIDRNSYIVAYFPTKYDIGLKFLIQAPFNTTPSRENIQKQDPWNIRIISEIANLISKALPIIKRMNLLTPSFLWALVPRLEKPQEISNEDELFMFKPIYDAIINALKNGEFLPTTDGGYVSAARGALPRGRELVSLLNDKQLRELFDKDKWISFEITPDKMFGLYKFIKEVLSVQEIEAEDFVRKLTKKFFEKQEDEWIDKFYIYVKSRRALWKKDYLNPSPILLRKEFVRLEDGSHIKPFSENGEIQVYLPPEDPHLKENIAQYFKFVKIENLSENAIDFLKKIGIKVPDKIDAVIDVVIPKMEKIGISINNKDGAYVIIKHLPYVLHAWLEKEGHPRENELISKLKKLNILYARNLGSGKWSYCSSTCNVILNESYIGERGKELKVFYDGNDEFWELDSQYIEELENPKSYFHASIKELDSGYGTTPKELLIEFLKDMGCITEININHRFPNWENYYVILEDRHGSHVRGLDGFDWNADIPGLEYVLKNITIERARIIWRVLSRDNNWKLIRGIVEKSSRKDFSNPKKVTELSRFGEKLSEYSWIPDKEGVFKKPSELNYHDINEYLLDGIEEQISQEIAKKLGIKIMDYSKLEEVIIESGGIEDEGKKRTIKKFLEVLFMINDHKKIESLLLKLQEITDSDNKKRVNKNRPIEDLLEIQEKWKNSLKKKGSLEVDEDVPLILGSDKSENGELLINKGTIEEKHYVHKKLKDSEDSEDIKEYLYSQYGGHCQICNTRLDVGEKKPPFVIFRIVEVKGKYAWANSKFNSLSLCPNCHTRMKVGGYDLTNVPKMAEKIKNGEYTAEITPGRPVNQGYEIEIQIAGKPETIFFSKDHMEKIVGLLKSVKE